MIEIFKDICYLVIMFVIVWTVFYLMQQRETLEQRMLRYHCDLTEFAAEVPKDVRNECRRLKIQSINNRKQNYEKADSTHQH